MPASVEQEPVEAKPALEPAKPARAPRPAKRAAGSIRRAQIGLSVLTQVLLFTVFIGMVNWIGFKYFRRFDYSRDRKFALSERTKQFLAGLNKPVKLIVFMSDQALLKSDATELVREYRNAQPTFIQIENVDPFREANRAAELARTYKLTREDNVVIVDADGRQKLVAQNTMADVEGGSDMFGNQTPQQITSWKGEQALTGALLEVVEGKKNIVYYLRGHAEPELGQKGPVGILQTYVERDNIGLKDFNLANSDTVPADANAVFLAGPKYDLSEREARALEDYWNTKQGRILVLLNPDGQTPRLNAFLKKTGITPDDNRVMAVITMGMTKEGSRIVQRAPGVAGEIIGASPIAERLKGVNILMTGSTQSFTLDRERLTAASVKVEPLAQAIQGYWGETDYREPDTPQGQQFTPGKDRDKDLFVAAVAERGGLEDKRVEVGTARLVAVGNSRFIENEGLDQGSADFLLGSLNWLLDREKLIGIPPKEIKTFSANFTPAQSWNIFLVTTLLIPAFFALLGFGVWWWRRN